MADESAKPAFTCACDVELTDEETDHVVMANLSLLTVGEARASDATRPPSRAPTPVPGSAFASLFREKDYSNVKAGFDEDSLRFNGHYMNVGEWLDLFEEAATAKQRSSEEKLQTVTDVIELDGLRWSSEYFKHREPANVDPLTKSNIFKQEFQATFGEVQTDKGTLDCLVARVQHDGEDYMNYHINKISLINCYNRCMTEREKVSHLMR